MAPINQNNAANAGSDGPSTNFDDLLAAIERRFPIDRHEMMKAVAKDYNARAQNIPRNVDSLKNKFKALKNAMKPDSRPENIYPAESDSENGIPSAAAAAPAAPPGA